MPTRQKHNNNTSLTGDIIKNTLFFLHERLIYFLKYSILVHKRYAHNENSMKKHMKRRKGYYSISAVAEMFSVHQQTIRLYEKEGLITPKRSDGNTRLFSEEDVNKLEEIIYLTHKLGINLSGVEMIFKQQKRIEKLQREINRLFKKAQRELEKEGEAREHAVKETAQELRQMREKPKMQEKQEASSADTAEDDDTSHAFDLQTYIKDNDDSS